MPKRLHNRLYLGCPLGTPKNLNLDAKTSPRWTPKISLFFQNPSKIVTIPIFGPWCFLEASKSLPRASQEPPKSLPRGSQEAYKPSGGTQEPPRSSRAAPKKSRATAHTSEFQNFGGCGARPVGVFDKYAYIVSYMVLCYLLDIHFHHLHPTLIN